MTFAGWSETSRPRSSNPLTRSYTCLMSVKDISDELVRQIADELRERHGLDEEDVRVLGARLAADSRSRENHRFAERFTDEHRETFDRLSQ